MNKDFQELKLQSKLVYLIGKIPSTLDFEFHFNFSPGSLKKHTHTQTQSMIRFSKSNMATLIIVITNSIQQWTIRVEPQ